MRRARPSACVWLALAVAVAGCGGGGRPAAAPPAVPPVAPPGGTPAVRGLGACSRMISDASPRDAPSLPLPGYRAPVVDPVFGTTITRVTGDPGTPIDGVDAGAWQEVAGPGYAKDQGWSADGALLVLRAGAADGMLFLDGNDYRVLAFRSSVAGLVTTNRWHPTRPGTMIFVDDSGRAGLWDPMADTVEWRFDPGGGYHGATLGKGEGNPSNDGTRIVVTATRSSDGAEVFFAADLSTGTKYPDVLSSDPRLGFDALDWASISPLGGFVVASQDWLKQVVLSLDGSTIVSRWEDMGHYDLGLDVTGDEVAYSAAGYMVRLSDGSRTDLFATGATDYHSSTRDTADPTWGFGGLAPGGAPLDGEIVAQELGASSRLRRFVPHRGTDGAAPGGYPHSTFAVPSPDGTRVLYRSDWGDASGLVYGFVVDARALCP